MDEIKKRSGDDNHRNWERKSEQLTKTHDINLLTNDQEGKRTHWFLSTIVEIK